jgi:peptidyl-prolyl cis-trans isomerase D
MLQLLRTGSKNPILKFTLFGLLLLGSGGMAISMGAGDMFRGHTHSTSVATIDGDAISKIEFDRILQDALRNKKMTPQEAYRQGFTEQTLVREVNSRLFVRAANDLGLVVDDGTVKKQLDSLLQPMMDKGMTERDALNEILYSFNTNESHLVGSLKAEIAVEKLSHALADGAHAPQQLVKDILKFRYESRRGEYIKLTEADAGLKEPSDSDLKDYYKTVQAHYLQPEYRSFALAVLDRKALGGKNPATDEEMKAYYDQHKDQFKAPEQRTVSEISTPDKDLADKLYAAAKHQKDLKAVAATGGKRASFTSGTFSKADFLPSELADSAFGAAAGTLLEPAKSALGWHVVRVDKVIPAGVRSYEEAKAEIEKSLDSGGDNSEDMYNKANEAEDMIGGGKSLADVAAAFKVKVLTYDKVDAKGLGPEGKMVDGQNVPGYEKVLAGVFKLDRGQVSQLIQAPGGEYVIAETHDIVPAATKPFDAVRDDVLRSWKEKQAGETLDTKAQKIVEQIKEGKSLESLAAELHKSMQTTPLISRNSPPSKAGIEPALLIALFAIDKTGQATAVPSPGAVTILRLSERQAEPPSAGKEEVEALQSMLSQSMQSDLLDEFRRSLMARYDASIDQEVLRSQYEPKGDENSQE